jgi:hypothetical protein
VSSKVNIAQASAEHGGNVAGLVSTVTRSGTNRFGGEVLEYFKDKSLNAITRDQERVGSEKPPYRRYQHGFGFGGPIIADRMHFYGAIELLTEKKSFTVNSGQPQFYSALHGTFPTNYLRRKYFGRVDLQINQNQSLFTRYALDWEHIDCESCGGTNASFNGNYVQSPRDTAVTGHNWVISNSSLNELRVQWPARLRNQTGPPGTELWKAPGSFPTERLSCTHRSTTSRACTGDRPAAASSGPTASRSRTTSRCRAARTSGSSAARTSALYSPRTTRRMWAPGRLPAISCLTARPPQFRG